MHWRTYEGIAATFTEAQEHREDFALFAFVRVALRTALRCWCPNDDAPPTR